MKTLAEARTDALAIPGVHDAKIWNDRRVYVSFVGYNSSFAGCRNLKVFYEPRRGWCVEGIKGNYASEFARNARAFLSVVGCVNAAGGSYL